MDKTISKVFSKLTIGFQKSYFGNNLYDPSIISNIDSSVNIHPQTLTNPLSSSAACLNVLGSIMTDPVELKNYLNALGIPVAKIIQFPRNSDIGGRVYKDNGYVVFEWVGPLKSPLHEIGGCRGKYMTSIDAYILCEIDNTITQLIIEWKFTEGESRELELERFGGLRGLERLRRYSTVLNSLKKDKDFPFNFAEDGGIGLFDFSPDHLYQLLRMTLLAKKTTPILIGNIAVMDYRIVHLTHSQNNDINILLDKYLTHSPGLNKYANYRLHHVWKELLSSMEKEKFIGAYWDQALPAISDLNLKQYLLQRYF
jgi:hypothetical protein